MITNLSRSTGSAALATALLGGLAGLTAGCTPPGHAEASSEACSSPETPSGPYVVVLAPGASPALTGVMTALASDPTKFTGQLGMSEAPTVDLETYDAEGQLTPHGLFNLNGTGKSNKAQSADASTEAACLKIAASGLEAASARADLVRSLPTAAATAAANGNSGAAVLAFGLGESAIEKTPVAKVDLTTATARARAISVLQRDDLLPAPTDVPVMLVAPGAGIANGTVANDVATFAQTNLCPAVSKVCSAPTVLG